MSEQLKPSAKSLTQARKLIKSWDLQHGYDDIDWRDKLAEVVPELAAIIDSRSDLACKVLAAVKGHSETAQDEQSELEAGAIEITLRQLFADEQIELGDEHEQAE